MKKSIDQINQMNKNAIHLNFGGIDEILSNKLFLSGDDVASNFNILNEKKITHILIITLLSVINRYKSL